MPSYIYKARDIGGKPRSGTLVIASQEAASESLRRNGLFVVSLLEEDTAKPEKAPFFRHRVKLSDFVVFSRQFASMVKAGMPLVQTLECLSAQTESLVLRAALKTVRREVETGSRLSVAMEGQRQVFPEMFISLVHAGEAGGSLEQSLEMAAVQFDKDQELLEKVKSAFTYPIIVLCATALVITIMLTCIVPTFTNIYHSLHAELPFMTRMLVHISYVMTHDTLLVILAIAGLAFLVRQIYRTDGGRLFFDRLKLRLPVLGPLNRKIAIGRFVRTLCAMIQSGLPLTRGLEIAAGVAGNRVIAEAALGVIKGIRKGEPLSEPLQRSGEFPPMVTQMVAVGEEAGNLEMMLHETARFYDRDVEYNVKRLTTLLEPLLTAFLAVVVGFVVISLYLPIFGLGKVLMHSN
jgi:type IV pilus assembly protein PilC